MSPAFSAESRSLERLLSDPFVFRVPDYQRSYSWTTKEASQLIDDLMIASSEARTARDGQDGYFLGAVLLMQLPPEPATTPGGRPIQPLDIVDGQQRLITLTIMLAVIRDLALDRGLALDRTLTPLVCAAGMDPSTPVRIMPRGVEGAFLARFVQAPGAALEMPEEDGLREAEQRILAVREGFAEVLHGLDDAELEHFATFLCRSCHFAVVTTSTIDRAHRIFSVLNERGRPLARNDILKAQILGGMRPDDRPGAAVRWAGMERRLEGSFEELFSHVRAIGTSSRGTIIEGIGGMITEAGGPLPFFEDVLMPYAEIFAAIRAPQRSAAMPSAKVARYVSYLSWLGSSDWVPALMLYWRRCGGDPVALEAFLARFERLGFGLRLLGIGADKRLTRYAAILSRLREGHDLDTPDSPLEFSREEQRNILYNLRGLHARSQLTCKLLLLRLNDEIAGTPQHLDPANFTVEHVLPQKPGRNSEWRAWFPLADDRESATQSLGNLVLVSREQNDRARNMELGRKLDVYFAPGTVVPHITRDLMGVTEWRQAQILERERRLQALVFALWGFSDAKASGAQAVADADAVRQPRRRRAQAAGD